MTNARDGLQTALEMARAGEAAVGLSGSSEINLVSSKDAVGAPDDESYAIRVFWVADGRVDVDAQRDVAAIWGADFGFKFDRDDAEATFLRSGEWIAEAGVSAEEADGQRRVWFSITTEFFDPDDAVRAVDDHRLDG